VGLDASEDGKISSYYSNYHPKIDVQTKPTVALEEAVETARKTYSKRQSSQVKERDAALIIYPETTEGKIVYHLAWRFMLAGEQPDPELEKHFIVDAHSGKIISSYAARFPGANVTGQVQCEIYPENPTDPVTTEPCRNARVSVEDAGNAVTNNSGARAIYFLRYLMFYSGTPAIKSTSI